MNADETKWFVAGVKAGIRTAGDLVNAIDGLPVSDEAKASCEEVAAIIYGINVDTVQPVVE